MKARAIVVVLAAAGLSACGNHSETVSYSKQVKPLLEKNCLECHQASGEGYNKSGLRLDSYEALMAGTKFGPVVVAGSSVSSSLYLVVSGKTDPSIHMPHNREPLPSTDVELIAKWIDQGAKNN